MFAKFAPCMPHTTSAFSKSLTPSIKFNLSGNIISNPSITVRDKTEGKIQVGVDFSVKTRDFAGNTTEQFFPAGTIIIVTAYIQKEGGLEYALLDIGVERSSFQTSELQTEIRKNPED